MKKADEREMSLALFQIVLLTDGNSGVGPGSLSATLSKFATLGSKSPVPYPFPSRLHVVSLLEPDSQTSQHYNKLVEMNYGHGQVSLKFNQALNVMYTCRLIIIEIAKM